jgi:hypothetical protein
MEMQERSEAKLRDWLYPDAQYGGGGYADDYTFGHSQYQTGDPLERVRTYYWEKITLGMPERNGSVYAMDGDSPWLVRSLPDKGGSWMAVSVTPERLVSIVAAPAAEDGQVALFFTWKDH